MQRTDYLLDTNILVALIRGRGLGERVEREYALRSNLARCMVCVVTVGECLALARKLNWGAARVDQLESLLEQVPWIDIGHPSILGAYAELDHASRLAGRAMGQNDLWIAASARATGGTLLTTDRDFEHLGDWLKLVWIDPRAGRP